MPYLSYVCSCAEHAEELKSWSRRVLVLVQGAMKAVHMKAAKPLKMDAVCFRNIPIAPAVADLAPCFSLCRPIDVCRNSVDPRGQGL